MDFWLMDVHSTVVVNGKDVAFDYINTFYEESNAIREAKLLSQDENVLKCQLPKFLRLNIVNFQIFLDLSGIPPYGKC